jgi:hypothetical protein
MSSVPLENTDSDVQVTVIASHGIWLQVRGREVFMSYDDFPGFRDAPMGKVRNVREPVPGQLCWPDFDVMVTIETFEHPERGSRKAV